MGTWLTILPVKKEAPEVPEEDTRLRVASMVSFTCAFQFRPPFTVVYTAPWEVIWGKKDS